MTTHVVMPHLGENVTEGVITRWLVQAGDTVSEGDPLLEVATDKVDTEVPAPAEGAVREVLASERSTIAVGGSLAIIESLQHADQIDRTPLTEEPRHAAEGSTVDGDRTEKLSRLRRVIARRMVESLQTSAQLTTVVEADMTRLSRLRNERKEAFQARTGIKLTFLPFFVMAVVDALAEHPALNASVSEDHTEAIYYGACHLGIAVDTPRGLLVPVIRNAGRLSIEEIACAVADLAGRARNGKIAPDDLAGGTFTITNTGSRGALFDTPIINPPQSGILGLGAVVDRVVPVSDGAGGYSVAIRPMIYLSLSYDHRLVDGADAARFLSSVKTRIEAAEFGDDV